MNYYLILCRSLTYAQRAERLLNEKGIGSVIVKAPQSLRTGGCGYALSLHKNFHEAADYLAQCGLLRGKIYRREENGDYAEVRNDIPR